MLSMLATVAAVPASAQGASDVYVLHGIPGVNVDVYVNGNLTLEGFEPEDIAGPLALPAGNYDIDIFAQAASPAATTSGRSDAVVIDVNGAAIPADSSVSLIAHLDAGGVPTLSAFVNDLSAPADSNTGRVTIRHTAKAPAVDIVAAGAAVAPLTNIANGQEKVADLPAASYPTGIAAAGTTAVLFDAPVDVQAGSNLVVYAIGDLASSFTLITQRFNALGSVASDVRVIHGIPGLDVDVYAGGNLLLPGFAPKTVTDALALQPGDLSVEIFAASSAPAATSAERSDAAAISQVVSVPSGLDIDLIAFLNEAGTPSLQAFVNDTSTIADPINGRVTVRHTAKAPTVDIVAGGAAVAPLTGISNGGEAAAELPAGSYPTGIAAAGMTDVLFDAPVSLVPGQSVTVYAIGDLASSFDLIVRSENGLNVRPDYRNTAGLDATLVRTYLAVLGRNPDAGGFAFWQGQAADGRALTDIIAFFETSDEFTTRFPDVDTDREFLDLAYQHVFGRPGDAGGLAYWENRLSSGDINRHEMLLFFADSPEFREYTGTN